MSDCNYKNCETNIEGKCIREVENGCKRMRAYNQGCMDSINEVILFIQKWRDRQVCIGRKVVHLIANEIIDSIMREYFEEKEDEIN